VACYEAPCTLDRGHAPAVSPAACRAASRPALSDGWSTVSLRECHAWDLDKGVEIVISGICAAVTGILLAAALLGTAVVREGQFHILGTLVGVVTVAWVTGSSTRRPH